MAHGSTLYAAEAAAGAKDGSSLANAAGIDPGSADDIWTIVNSDTPAAGGTTIKLCSDGSVTTTATIEITQDGTAANPFIVQPRDATDSADSTITLDANGGAFPVVTLTTADYWIWIDVDAYNTDGNSPNDGWLIGANADYGLMLRCKARDVCSGFTSLGSISTFVNCLADSNSDHGFDIASNNWAYACIASGNTNYGFYRGNLSLCIASGNGDDGYYGFYVATQCVSYGNGGSGFTQSGSLGACVECVAEGNTGYGFEGIGQLVRCGDYNNTAGRPSGVDSDLDPVTAVGGSFFVNAAAGDFTPNSTASRGALLRQCGGSGEASIDGNFTDYRDYGAVTHEDPAGGGGGRCIIIGG